MTLPSDGKSDSLGNRPIKVRFNDVIKFIDPAEDPDNADGSASVSYDHLVEVQEASDGSLTMDATLFVMDWPTGTTDTSTIRAQGITDEEGSTNGMGFLVYYRADWEQHWTRMDAMGRSQASYDTEFFADNNTGRYKFWSTTASPPTDRSTQTWPSEINDQQEDDPSPMKVSMPSMKVAFFPVVTSSSRALVGYHRFKLTLSRSHLVSE